LDHLFFTGSTAVGRKVMAAAAPNLTPVTLELGGKSPVIIAPGYPLPTAVDRIAAGKFLNAGQTCIAPDYVLLPKAAIPEFVQEMQKYISQRYANLAANPDYSSIVNSGQYARLKSYLDQAHAAGAKIIELAAGDAGQRILPPTLVLDARDDLALMQDEIFGPILPLVAVDSVDAAIDYINARPRPLAGAVAAAPFHLAVLPRRGRVVRGRAPPVRGVPQGQLQRLSDGVGRRPRHRGPAGGRDQQAPARGADRARYAPQAPARRGVA